MGGVRRFKHKKKKPVGKDQGERKSYSDIVKENENFVKYYKEQGIVQEQEWDEFLKYLKTELPTAFRISARSKAESRRLMTIINSEFFSKLFVQGDQQSVDEDRVNLKPLAWYPNELAWQIQLSRRDIRRSQIYFRLHNFLISETASGNISRQEAVSMIPPLALDIQPSDKVLDMCAAPGSKTGQIIEKLHESDALPTGFVVANDVDNSRCYMLVHQAKRLNSPCCIVTNHDASFLPNFHSIVKEDDGGERVEIVKFDKVLCDVPCSGDGTLRKNADIWTKWNVHHANNLQGIQFRIIKRGVELLRIGGRLVYSTCSLNPVENEAVIKRLLDQAGDSIALENAPALLGPELKSRPGLTQWTRSKGEIEEFPHGINCLRILPQDGDTGAFFVAVLTKLKPLPWESSSSQPCGPENDEVTQCAPQSAKPPPKRRRIAFAGHREDPFVFFKEDEPVWESVKHFYEISSSFDPTCLLTRSHVGKKKNVYFVSSSVRRLIQDNENRVKIINAGVKIFARSDNKGSKNGCDFRLAQEGLSNVAPFLGSRRRVPLKLKDALIILQNFDPHSPTSLLEVTEETRQNCDKLTEQGSCLLDVIDDHNEEGVMKVGFELTLAGWKGTKSLRAYVSKADALHYLRLFGVDTSKYDVNKFIKEEVEEDKKVVQNEVAAISVEPTEETLS